MSYTVVLSIEPSIRLSQEKSPHNHNLAENDKNLPCSSAVYGSVGDLLSKGCCSFESRGNPHMNLFGPVVQLSKKKFFSISRRFFSLK